MLMSSETPTHNVKPVAPAQWHQVVLENFLVQPSQTLSLTYTVVVSPATPALPPSHRSRILLRGQRPSCRRVCNLEAANGGGGRGNGVAAERGVDRRLRRPSDVL